MTAQRVRFALQVRDEQDAPGEWRDVLESGDKRWMLDCAAGASEESDGEEFRVYDRLMNLVVDQAC